MERALKILLVEDAEEDAQFQFRALERSGLSFEARQVQTEAEFLVQLAEYGPDIIVSDYSIPGFGGMRALEIARQHVPDLPFVFVSGAMGEDKAAASIRRRCAAVRPIVPVWDYYRCRSEPRWRAAVSGSSR